MATVTVYSAERTAEIEAGTVVDGSVNENGDLILERRDGTPINAGAISAMKVNNGSGYVKADTFAYVGASDPGAVPNGSVWYDTSDIAGPSASDTQKGYVELATNAETITGTDTQRAVTPAGLAARIAADNTANPGYKTQILAANSKAESAAPAAYPYGVSMMSVTTGWSLNGGFGVVVTNSIETDRTNQTFYSVNGGTAEPKQWVRTYHSSGGGGGWTAWHKVETIATLLPTSYTDSSAPTTYPLGTSRIIFTTANSSSWVFSGMAGELMTYRDGTNLTKQVFTSLAAGSGNYSKVWVRTASDSGGWGAWRRTAFEDQILTYAFGTATVTPSAANTPTSLAVSFPAGRFSAAPNVQVSLQSTVPGSQVTGIGYGNVTSTGFTVYVTRTNTTATIVGWSAFL